MTQPAYPHAARMLVCLYLVEAAIFLILVGIYKAPVFDWPVLTTKAGATLFVGSLGLAASGWLLAMQLGASGSLRREAFALALDDQLTQRWSVSCSWRRRCDSLGEAPVMA
jgi:hypothetical protein